jgi:hypothetical protein
MNKRAFSACLLTGGLVTGLVAATVTPAAAQGDPVWGEGNVYYFSGALNDSGQAQRVFSFGDPDDEVYMGDWYGDGVDLPMVRRGNIYFVPDSDNPNITQSVFAYGDAEDEVYVGDWDGDGVDSLAVRRVNHYFVKNDNTHSGKADSEFLYGDPEDIVLVGNWNGTRVAPTADAGGKGDTLMVQRGNRFFVKNDLATGMADYTFLFGDAEDYVLAGDWITIGETATGEETVESGDGADQLAVVRGNQYYLSTELEDAATGDVNPSTARVLAYGDPDDAVFVASLPTPLDADGQVASDPADAVAVIEGDGMGVRRPR